MKEIYPPYQKIPQVCKLTGFSQYFLRKGCKEGTIPHKKSGPVYYINVNAFLRQLNEQAEEDNA